MPSWMNIHDGNLMDPTTNSFCTRCFNMLQPQGKKENDQAIYWGQWQPLPEWDLEVESSAVELIGPKSPREEIRGVYNDVYQLQKSLGKNPYDAEMEERVCQENSRLH